MLGVGFQLQTPAADRERFSRALYSVSPVPPARPLRLKLGGACTKGLTEEMQTTRMTVIIAHELFGSEQVIALLIAQFRCQSRLDVEREPFGLAARQQVRAVTHAPEKIVSALD